MWPIPFPKEQVASTINQKETWVVENIETERIVATFRLVWSDPIFWGPQPPVAGYLHKLAVGRAFAHQGIGPKIMDYVQGLVRQKGREYLRLDCIASNHFIMNYYKARGFRPVRVLNMNLDRKVHLVQMMEKSLINGSLSSSSS